jgi:hypothetical protein
MAKANDLPKGTPGKAEREAPPAHGRTKSNEMDQAAGRGNDPNAGQVKGWESGKHGNG